MATNEEKAERRAIAKARFDEMLAHGEMPKGVTLLDADTPEGLKRFDALTAESPNIKVLANFDWCKDTIRMLNECKEQIEAAAQNQPVIMLYTNKAQDSFNAIKTSRKLPEQFQIMGENRRGDKKFFQCPSLVSYENGNITDVTIAEHNQSFYLKSFFSENQTSVEPEHTSKAGGVRKLLNGFLGRSE